MGHHPIPQMNTKTSQVKGIEQVFRNVCIVLFLILVFCVPGFLKFRHYCESKGYYVFAADSFRWCMLGFFLVFVSVFSFRLPNTDMWH